MLLDIIIINWNTCELLLQCLRSLDKVKLFSKHRIIVVDNGSSDGSAKEVSDNRPDVILIENHENYGFAKGNNIGICQSQSEYVCLINSDVIVLDGCIESLIDFMISHTDVGMIGPKLLNADGSFQLSCKRFPTVWNAFCMAVGLHRVFPKSRYFCGTEMTDICEHVIQDVEAIAGAFLLVRRATISEIGLLDEDFFFYGEDIDWCKRVHDGGWRLVYYPLAKAVHLGGSSSSKDPFRFQQELYSAKLRYWKKHHGKLRRTLFVLIIMSHLAARIFALRLWQLGSKTTDLEMEERLSSYSTGLLLLRNHLMSF